MSKSLRIISGSLGSRRIKTLTNTNLKPTPEKLREILFAWLAQEVKEAKAQDPLESSDDESDDGSALFPQEAAQRGVYANVNIVPVQYVSPK